jgi:K+-transporting ATPase KdpF subunit
MNWLDITSLLLAALIALYLVYALLHGEEF